MKIFLEIILCLLLSMDLLIHTLEFLDNTDMYDSDLLEDDTEGSEK